MQPHLRFLPVGPLTHCPPFPVYNCANEQTDGPDGYRLLQLS